MQQPAPLVLPKPEFAASQQELSTSSWMKSNEAVKEAICEGLCNVSRAILLTSTSPIPDDVSILKDVKTFRNDFFTPMWKNGQMVSIFHELDQNQIIFHFHNTYNYYMVAGCFLFKIYTFPAKKVLPLVLAEKPKRKRKPFKCPLCVSMYFVCEIEYTFYTSQVFHCISLYM